MAQFEDNLKALENVVEKLEHGDLSLEESVKLFEEGVKLSSACKLELDAAEGRVQVLVEQGKGKPKLAAIDIEQHEEEFEDEDE